MEDLRNLFVMPAWLFQRAKRVKMVPDIYCPDDRFYLIDDDGNVHYFVYQGENLAGMKTDA